MRRFALIGYGAITEELVSRIERRGELEALLAVLVRPQRLAEARARAAGRFAVVDRLEALIEPAPAVVAECAGHAAMRQYAPALLSRGIDVICSSVGVLADREFESRLTRASADGDGRLWIPSGAVAGIDGLLAARTAGLNDVTYTSIKPPAAWDGTPGERLLAGAARGERTTFFEGSAREAATQYPQNANVGATVALAGLGLDRTRVKLVSDPSATGPLGIIEAEGEFGSMRFEILAYASPRNPKTSLLTAHSLYAALRERICFAMNSGAEFNAIGELD
jgi:aspartate dehydrogenase